MSVDPADIPAKGGVVLIDWGCGFCQATRRWVQRHAPPDRFVFHALASPEGRAWLSHIGWQDDPPDAVVLIERDRWSMKSTAVLRIVRRMRGGWRMLYAFIVVPRPLRDLGYQAFSKVRHRFGPRA